MTMDRETGPQTVCSDLRLTSFEVPTLPLKALLIAIIVLLVVIIVLIWTLLVLVCCRRGMCSNFLFVVILSIKPAPTYQAASARTRLAARGFASCPTTGGVPVV